MFRKERSEIKRVSEKEREKEKKREAGREGRWEKEEDMWEGKRETGDFDGGKCALVYD